MAFPEGDILEHPYQRYGPKGAYEARQVLYTHNDPPGGPATPGLYVRVDMPGVPDNGLKVVCHSNTRTVTFTGKAPVVWARFDTSERAYGGYVALDRDPADVDFKTQFKEGCLRFFFPYSDGSLHFISPPGSSTPNTTQVASNDDDDDDDDDDTVEILEGLGERYITFAEHAPNSSVITLRGGRPEHINPFLLKGVEGVYEHKVVKFGDGEQIIYMRLDVPDADYKFYLLGESGGPIVFAGDAPVCSPFDECGRGFIGLLKPKCTCCEYEVIDHGIKNGVIRFLARKTHSTDPPCSVYTMQPSSVPGEALKPVKLKIDLDRLMGNIAPHELV